MNDDKQSPTPNMPVDLRLSGGYRIVSDDDGWSLCDNEGNRGEIGRFECVDDALVFLNELRLRRCGGTTLRAVSDFASGNKKSAQMTRFSYGIGEAIPKPRGTTHDARLPQEIGNFVRVVCDELEDVSTAADMTSEMAMSALHMISGMLKELTSLRSDVDAVAAAVHATRGAFLVEQTGDPLAGINYLRRLSGYAPLEAPTARN